MRKQIYKAICEKLSEKVDGVQFISIWNRLRPLLADLVDWPRPAVFIEFEPIEWSQQQNWVRRGNVLVRLHIITDAAAFSGSTDDNQESALACFDLIDSINDAMQGLSGENFSALMLVRSFTNHNHGDLIDNVEEYVTSVQDTTSMKNLQEVTIDNLTVKKA